MERVPVGWTETPAGYLGFYLYMQPPTAGRYGLYGSYDLDLLGLHPDGCPPWSSTCVSSSGRPSISACSRWGASTTGWLSIRTRGGPTSRTWLRFRGSSRNRSGCSGYRSRFRAATSWAGRGSQPASRRRGGDLRGGLRSPTGGRVGFGRGPALPGGIRRAESDRGVSTGPCPHPHGGEPSGYARSGGRLRRGLAGHRRWRAGSGGAGQRVLPRGARAGG